MTDDKKWKIIKSAIIDPSLAFPAGKVLDALLGVVRSELGHIDKKLEKLLRNPFSTAERHLELARKYQQGSVEQTKELEIARNLYNKAASNLDGLEKSKSLMASSACAALMNDLVAKQFYKEKAKECLEIYHRDNLKIYKSLTGSAKRAVAFGSAFVGTTWGAGALFLLAVSGVGLPAAVFGGVAAVGAAAATATLPSTLKLSETVNETACYGELMFGGLWEGTGEGDGSGSRIESIDFHH